MATFDDEILLLRPVEGSVDTAAVEARLTATPGAFRDPIERATWILARHPQDVDALRRARLEQPGHYPPDPRIAVSPEDVVVVPGTATRERAFVTWLLSQAPWELSVRGELVGRVSSPADIYASEDWQDPALAADPTGTPPLTGAVLTIEREGDVLSEQIAVHDAGVMSYEQLRPVADPAKTYRRLSPELLARWHDLVARLPLDADAPGPDGAYVDPVFVRLDEPTDLVAMPKIDAARPPDAYRELLALVDGWAAALRADRAAMPAGLIALSDN